MPAATVGEPQMEQGGLLTNWKKEFLNHLRVKHQSCCKLAGRWVYLLE